MGPKTKETIEAIVNLLREYPRDHHMQLLQWAENIASGAFTIDEIARGGITWDRRGTFHERSYPDYNPDFSK